MKKEVENKRQRDGVALRSSKRCLVAMAAPSLRSPWERLNPVAARLCPWARERERMRGGKKKREKKNSNRTASLARGVWADLEKCWACAYSLSFFHCLSLLFPHFISLSLTLSIDF